MFEDIISVNNLLLAWREFIDGKKKKPDVQEFQSHLMMNILALHEELINGQYQHGPYHEFRINDPKPRTIHKATVRDRLVHRAIYRKLYPFFDKAFIADSFSCRVGKGTHRAIQRFEHFARVVSKNHTRTCWVLKCDIRKFFHSIDQAVLLEILDKRITDKRIRNLLREIIGSFPAGLPLGNLTSQLFCNVYLHQFDRFMKQGLKVKYYIRYADDFVLLSHNKEELESLILPIGDFLQQNLGLSLHPDKVFIKTIASGVDFLGWIQFIDHRVLRTTTKKHMFRRIVATNKEETAYSYLGMLSHGNGRKLQESIMASFDSMM